MGKKTETTVEDTIIQGYTNENIEELRKLLENHDGTSFFQIPAIWDRDTDYIICPDLQGHDSPVNSLMWLVCIISS